MMPPQGPATLQSSAPTPWPCAEHPESGYYAGKDSTSASRAGGGVGVMENGAKVGNMAATKTGGKLLFIIFYYVHRPPAPTAASLVLVVTDAAISPSFIWSSVWR